MRVVKNKVFARFAERNGIEDRQLCDAVHRAERGLIDADLGGGVIKQRVARPGKGRSGGFRTIVLFHTQERAFFAHGFAKNQKANLIKTELQDFKALAKYMLILNEAQLKLVIEAKEIIEVKCNDENIYK